MPEQLPPPALVADAAALAAMLRELQSEPLVAVDTESNSLHAYRERVCLIQFSSPTRDYLLDPLPLADLAPLGALFANPAQEKIFHAAEYDLLCLKRDYHFEFAHLFDTMVAARSLAWPAVGLAPILEVRFGVKMDKKHQRADWGKRPLTPEQLDYARLDTHFLIPLRAMQLDELAQAGRLDEAREDFARLTLVTPEPNGTAEPDRFWRVNGARDLTPAQAGALKALHAYREQQAEQADRPPFKVMSDETLVAIARACPKQESDLHHLPGMTPGQVRRHGPGLLAAVQNGLSGPPPRPPRYTREPDSVRERYDLLHKWRKEKGKARGVESDVILPREALWELARSAPRTTADLAAIQHLGPWRRETYGLELLKLLNAANGRE